MPSAIARETTLFVCWSRAPWTFVIDLEGLTGKPTITAAESDCEYAENSTMGQPRRCLFSRALRLPRPHYFAIPIQTIGLQVLSVLSPVRTLSSDGQEREEMDSSVQPYVPILGSARWRHGRSHNGSVSRSAWVFNECSMTVYYIVPFVFLFFNSIFIFLPSRTLWHGF
ncbi:hypothetical protein EDD17DRAFT_188256 [Pisolithus thermaeus]|nr:hypothetical protein EV401DRAFT_232650 [Pisolithus croceorrhizus]KAI6165825.1 hypothetical protein EDD17DRAFT_188256 [Pisolithus thermaeus]